MKRFTGLILIAPGLLLTGMISLPGASLHEQQTKAVTQPVHYDAPNAELRMRQVKYPFVMSDVHDENRDLKGYTDLMWAAENGHATLVAELLAAGADPKATNWWGQSALELARAKGHENVMALLKQE
ncbi:Ankyrin [Magnetococcus marinus MC-1]|uniref:Ankyrin n=1 Tax=Magnetococcus marinus (strain ATCC BAA-1437 / JCM 17883 / MC-1) TaxID=156889 RepID=A0L9I1_MAGMM|nr:ankyrin repeat domain-containing protein [Magnetococcus marinus]ABK44624.1 Ankyrin [Magnetococcus marinus MC-1]